MLFKLYNLVSLFSFVFSQTHIVYSRVQTNHCYSLYWQFWKQVCLHINFCFTLCFKLGIVFSHFVLAPSILNRNIGHCIQIYNLDLYQYRKDCVVDEDLLNQLLNLGV